MIADSQIARLSLRIRTPPGRDAPVGGRRSYHSEVTSSAILDEVAFRLHWKFVNDDRDGRALTIYSGRARCKQVLLLLVSAVIADG